MFNLQSKKINRFNSERMREYNENIVLNLIRENSPISRVKLSRMTGLKESTVSSIIKKLLAQKILTEEGVGESTGGRKPRMLRLNEDKSVIIAVAIGIRQTTIAVSNFTGGIISRKNIKTENKIDVFLGKLAAELKKVRGSGIPLGREIEGIGISMPGLLDPSQGEIIYSANLNWKNVAVGKFLEEELNLSIGKGLFFEEEVRSAALAEMWFGGLHDTKYRHIVNVAIGDGLGAGIIIGGQLYTGISLGAGQYGHISIDPRGPECTCGNRGCWEVYSADRATVNRYIGYCKKSTSKSKKIEDISMDEVVRLAKEGDKNAIKTLKVSAQYIGEGISFIVNTLNPEVVVVSGKISQAWDIISEDIIDSAKSKALKPNMEKTDIRPSIIVENPSLIGAIAVVLQEGFKSKK